jgi:hypothetical protein
MSGATSANSDAIAIIGMAGRFPGAGNVEQLWELLKNGTEARTRLTDEELRRAGVDDALLSDPNYVKACIHPAASDAARSATPAISRMCVGSARSGRL